MSANALERLANPSYQRKALTQAYVTLMFCRYWFEHDSLTGTLRDIWFSQLDALQCSDGKTAIGM